MLIHGFAATPAQMRPLAQALHQADWTVEGILLPGFGPELFTLPDKQYNEWVGHVRNILRGLRERHEQVLVVGFSLGAAVALRVAQQEDLSGLCLLAPFWQLDLRSKAMVRRVVKSLWAGHSLTKRRPLLDPELRQLIRAAFPQADPDTSELHQALRRLARPLSVFREIIAMGRSAYKASAHITVPTLLIQGTRDDIATKGATRKLLTRIPGRVSYAELDGDHALMDPSSPAWPQVSGLVVDFAELVKTGHAMNRDNASMTLAS